MRYLPALLLLGCSATGRLEVMMPDLGGGRDGGNLTSDGAAQPDLRIACGMANQLCCPGDTCTDRSSTCVQYVRADGAPYATCDLCGHFGQKGCQGPATDAGQTWYCVDGLPPPDVAHDFNYCGCGVWTGMGPTGTPATNQCCPNFPHCNNGGGACNYPSADAGWCG